MNFNHKAMNLLITSTTMVILMLISCTDDGFPDPLVEVQFNLLNEAGIPTSTFNKGEDILYRYCLTNRSETLLVVTNLQEIIGNDFMLTLQLIYGDDGVLVERIIGFPYDGIRIPDKFGYAIETLDSLVMQAIWKGNLENTKYIDGFVIEYKSNRNSLSSGKYKVEFEHAFTFTKYADKVVQIENPFIIL